MKGRSRSLEFLIRTSLLALKRQERPSGTKSENTPRIYVWKLRPVVAMLIIEDLLPFWAWVPLQRRIHRMRINISSFTKHKMHVCRGAVCVSLLFAAKCAVTSGSPRHFPLPRLPTAPAQDGGCRNGWNVVAVAEFSALQSLAASCQTAGRIKIQINKQASFNVPGSKM